MSFNRLRYDNCAYGQHLAESVGTLAYQLDPNRFENNNKCRMEFGIVGGSAVSHVKGNLVDLESDLRGTTRLQSKCPELQYQNPCPSGDMTTCRPNDIVIKANPANSGRVVDTTPQHLPACQMIRYKPTPLPPQLKMPGCSLDKAF